VQKIIISLVALTLSGAALTTGVMAQTTPTPDFATVDSDKSGEVSFGELEIVMPKLTKAAFDAADADKSGGLSATEFATVSDGGTGSLTEMTPATPATPATTPAK
jgi:hypothetical protein